MKNWREHEWLSLRQSVEIVRNEMILTYEDGGLTLLGGLARGEVIARERDLETDRAFVISPKDWVGPTFGDQYTIAFNNRTGDVYGSQFSR
jgi:hypothetical protein